MDVHSLHKARCLWDGDTSGLNRTPSPSLQHCMLPYLQVHLTVVLRLTSAYLERRSVPGLVQSRLSLSVWRRQGHMLNNGGFNLKASAGHSE